MIRAIDPSPCPSYKGVPEDHRLSHLERQRSGVDQVLAVKRLETVTDALIDASVPEVYKNASSSLAADWTDHETWSRPRPKDDPQPANDPDASWGHAKRNAPGAVDHLFFGYYAQAATMVKDDRGKDVPELVRGVVFLAPRHDPAAAMAEELLRRSRNGLSFNDVLADCGYSNRNPENFARVIRRAGADLTIDLHPEDRGPKGTYKGAVVLTGTCFVRALQVLFSNWDPSKEDPVFQRRRSMTPSPQNSPATSSDGYHVTLKMAPTGRCARPSWASSVVLFAPSRCHSTSNDPR